MRAAPFASMITAGSLSVLCAFALGSCTSASNSTTRQTQQAKAQATPDAPVTVAHADNAPPKPTTAPSAAAPAADAHAHALHNVHELTPKIISGAVPDGDAAFDELHAMGVKTIISVDGASPNVAAAEARGMRYVHLPVTYAEVTEEQRLEIARAIRDLPGPVYVHCHHGKHRSPAATAAAGVALGVITPEQGLAFMKEAGTAPNYQGLYACVATATVADEVALDAVPADFPSVHRAQGIVASMVETDVAMDNVNAIRAAKWKTPADHPDLVPAAEAGRLADNLRFASDDAMTKAWGDDFAKRLQEAVALASALEEAIVRNASLEELEAAYKPVSASCKDCHAVYRDKPR